MTELRQQIDHLAMGLVVADGAEPGSDALAPIASSLRAIAGDARDAGREDIANLAAGLLQSISGPERGESLAQVLQDGVTRLQTCCEAESAAPSSSLADDPELMRDFILEAREHLASIEQQALELERNPLDHETLHAAFRAFHTIKGLAGFLELAEVQAVAHEVEALLDRARNAQLRVDSPAIDVVLQSADYLRRWLAHLESALAGNAGAAAPKPDEALLARIRAAAADHREEAALEPLLDTVLEPGPAEPPAEAVPGRNRRKSDAIAVKVETAKLDYLVDMAGEMVIAQSLVEHDPGLSASKSPALQRNLAQLKRIATELQKTAMSMRLVPVGPLFGRMARLVRDLSRQFGKSVEVYTEGDEIELDRTIVEELADPLMHMVRNSLDHGIETAAGRAASGKAPEARITLRAQHQAGHVVVAISDDGRGLDRAKILERAAERGLVADGSAWSDSDVFNLIFEPGFTTATEVTSVSGRGVGMDVVRKHVEKLRGRIEIRSTPGQGSTFVLKLPLTLAIIDGLVVSVGEERYILPIFAVREMLRPVEGILWTVRQQDEMALVRGELLPVIRLYRRFRTTPRSEDPRDGVLVVAETEGRRYCLLVDALIGKQEVVIKSLGETFKQVAGVSGGAILGDGRVGLILDLEGIFNERRSDAAH